jgi:hypothetical protein
VAGTLVLTVDGTVAEAAARVLLRLYQQGQTRHCLRRRCGLRASRWTRAVSGTCSSRGRRAPRSSGARRVSLAILVRPTPVASCMIPSRSTTPLMTIISWPQGVLTSTAPARKPAQVLDPDAGAGGDGHLAVRHLDGRGRTSSRTSRCRACTPDSGPMSGGGGARRRQSAAM